MRLESRPATAIAAHYTQLPFPLLAPMQEICFDLGVTATDTPLTLAGVVFQGYHEHQLIFEEQWPARIVRQHVGEDDLQIAPGTGLALRGLHFLVHGYEPLTHVTVTVLFLAEGRPGTGHMELQIPVRYHINKTDLHFPLRGAWWAIQGSDWSDQHKREVFSQAYAMDFVRLGPDNRMFRGAGLALEEHYSWGEPVYATAGGKVALAIYDMPDLRPGQPPDPRMFRGEPWRTLGNAVAISHGNGEVSYFGALQQASLAVNSGQMVRRGDLLGRVGNSGLSPGPHLHFHLAEGPNPFIDQGLPFKFSHFEAGGQWFTDPITVPTRLILIRPDTDTLKEER